MIDLPWFRLELAEYIAGVQSGPIDPMDDPHPRCPACGRFVRRGSNGHFVYDAYAGGWEAWC